MSKRGGRPPRPEAEKEFNRLLGERIEMLRKRAGVSVSAMAEAISVSHSRIYWYESGRTAPTPVILARIARELDVSVGALVPHFSTNSVQLLQIQKSLLLSSTESNSLADPLWNRKTRPDVKKS